jgi:hypothetical protein
MCYSLASGKKADQRQIDECVYKLPKALVDLASRVEGGKHIFFPVALFSGQIFAVTYKGSLVVEQPPFLQYYTSFRSDAYWHLPEPEMVELDLALNDTQNLCGYVLCLGPVLFVPFLKYGHGSARNLDV